MPDALASPRHPQLQAYAEAHARWMAEHDHQGHDEGQRRPWSKRRAEIVQTTKLQVEEILTESWPEQADFTEAELWGCAMVDWKAAGGGHWAIASVAHRWAGAALAKSERGIWFFAVLVAD